MLVNVDAKQLEWVVAVYLSQDKVGIQEILTGVDIHGINQTRFSLPTRTAAKVLIFRTLYGGSGYSFATDPEYSHIGGESWWDEAIAKFYAKYQGIYTWHEGLLERVVRNDGRLALPTGREYQFTPQVRRGEQSYPRTKVLNYPVQGLAADLMAIARVSLYKRVKAAGWPVLFVNTIHDSIVMDMPLDTFNTICYNSSGELIKMVQDVFKDIPANFERLFGVAFNLPLKAEITYGPDLGHMTEIL